MIAYTGNGAYCYANTLHMSLNAAGMTELPSSGFLECLTTMPFGCFLMELPDTTLFFPSAPGIEPDRGLTLAIEALGWTSDEADGGTKDEALARLRFALQTGSVLAGPLDMGFLGYNPEHDGQKGSDHFVMVIKATDDTITLHDPAWYPYATLSIEEFMEAWRGENITYGRHTYMMRSNFRQVEARSRQQMIAHVLPTIKANLNKAPTIDGFYHNADALCKLADMLRQEPSSDLRAFLIYFSLPLGARRCNDAAHFLAEAGLLEVAGVFQKKSALYGETQYHAAHGDWAKVAEIIDLMAEFEERLLAHL